MLGAVRNKEAMDTFRSIEQQLKSGGLSRSSLAQLNAYISEMEDAFKTDPDGEVKRELLRMVHESVLQSEKMEAENNLEQFRTVVANGRNALKFGVLVNGGAAVALLAFLGNLVSKSPVQPFAPEFAWPLACFTFGVFSGMFDHGLLYLVQYTFHHGNERLGRFLNFLCNCVAVVVYLSFAAGCSWACWIFLHMPV